MCELCSGGCGPSPGGCSAAQGSVTFGKKLPVQVVVTGKHDIHKYVWGDSKLD